jgi:hemerythrin
MMEENTQNSPLYDMLKLGIPIIDKQHEGFLTMIEATEKQYVKEQDITREKSLELIEAMEKYLNTHFKTEEALMRKAGYPKLPEHIKEHQFFIARVKEFKLEYSFRSSHLLDKLISFMKKWFFTHVLQTDSQFKDDVKRIIKTNTQ